MLMKWVGMMMWNGDKVGQGQRRIHQILAARLSSLATLNPPWCSALQVLTTQALVGTVIALIGTWLYTDMSSKHKKKPAGGSDAKPAAA
jgi:hypothetical protein